MLNDNKQYLKLCQKYSNFNVKPYLKNGMTKKKILQLKEAFDLFDIEHKGYLEIEELKKNLNNLNMMSKNNEIDELVNKGIENIDFSLFFELMSEKNPCKNIDDVKKLYCIFLGEDNIKKKLSIEHFKIIAKELELELAEGEIEEMINCIPNNEPGYINFDEFYKIMIKNDEEIN